MEKTTTKLWKVLPIVAAVLALGGCGGNSDDATPAISTPSSSGSIIACFTVNSTVSFSLTSSNVTSGQTLPNKSTTEQMTYNGQTVMRQTFSYPSGGTISTQSNYWKIASNGVTLIGSVINNGTLVPDDTFFSQNMSPGQRASDSNGDIATFVGFETVSLVSKTFTNTCHFSQGNVFDVWYAPGYGVIKEVEATGTVQYGVDL